MTLKKIGIIGASGYTGFELIKILSRHKDVELVALNSAGWGGKNVSELYTSFTSDLKFTDYTLNEIKDLRPDLLFLAMQENYARDTAPKLNCKVIDLSRDLRFKGDTAYGLPELFRSKIKSAKVVSNPGCYATASILAALPLVKEGIAKNIVFDCKSGYSGAGRTPSYLNDPKHYENNIIAYKLTQHNHRDEIEKCLNEQRAEGEERRVNVSFTPHVIPLFRGIMATAHILLQKSVDADKIRNLYTDFYAKEPFVKVVEKLPELHDVQNTNLCCIGGFEVDSNNRLVVVATIDNLLKGASGQAVQNMNLMLGFEETEGLI